MSNPKDRVCPECGTPVSRTSQSGLCRLHFNRRMANDPAVKAKKLQTLRNSMATNPAVRNSLRDAARRAAKTRWANPEYAEQMKRAMREVVQPKSLLPEYRHHRVAAALASAEKRLAWCPVEYRDLYRNLINNRKFTKAEAMPIILAQVKADRARELANLSPFERQMRALENGAPLIANDTAPMFGEALNVVGE